MVDIGLREWRQSFHSESWVHGTRHPALAAVLVDVVGDDGLEDRSRDIRGDGLKDAFLSFVKAILAPARYCVLETTASNLSKRQACLLTWLNCQGVRLTFRCLQ